MQPRARGLTESIAAFACAGRDLPLDDDLQELVKMAFADTAGVILAGKNQPVVDVMRRFVFRHGARPADARILFGTERVASRDAALINATAGHALDYDDVAFCGHPSVVLVPCLLAEGERLGSSGFDLIKAYVVGYEVWAELFFREPDLLHDKGWHSTGMLGIVSATAALASLRRLSQSQCICALGMAASMGGGVVANFGSEAKPFHAGYAAANAIDAVDLSVLGIKPSPDALEHPAGLLAALSPKGAVDLSPASSGFGRDLRLRELRLTFKNYPMCFATHRAIDATVALVRRYRVEAGTVKTVHVHLGTAQAAMLRNHRPDTGVEAKFSLEFAIAAALVAGGIGLCQVQDDFVRRADVRNQFDKVRIHLREGCREDQPSLAQSDRVLLELDDGRMLDSGEVQYAIGDAFNPMSFDDLRRKFDDCVVAAGETDRGGLFDALCQLEHCPDVGELELAHAQAPNAGEPAIHDTR